MEDLDKKKASSLEDLVLGVIDAVRGYNAKFNNDKTISVIDLGSRGAHQGVSVRQLFVEASQNFMTVSLHETYQSAHGGQEQRKVLFKFVVPVNETELFGLMQQRFYGYNRSKNIEQGIVLLDTLRQTVSTP